MQLPHCAAYLIEGKLTLFDGCIFCTVVGYDDFGLIYRPSTIA